MDFWKNNTIWFEQIPESRQMDLYLQEIKLRDTIIPEDLEYLILRHYKTKSGDFVGVPAPENLLYLELNWSNVQNFNGIEKLTWLRRLELYYCFKLQHDAGLSSLADNLYFLQIDQSRKFVPTEELFALKNLRVLRLNACGNLENLKFLKHFPHLVDFRFVDTNVLDGDLSPILEHPTIRSVGFFNKRHYNIKDKEMETLLREKNNGEPYEEIIRYGEFESFRYFY